jgi:Na+-driven multidrug efflux pump
MLPGVVTYSLEVAFGFFVMVKLKRPMLIFYIQGISTIVCALLTYVLMPKYGLVGAAFATSVTYIAVTLTVATIFVRTTHTPVLDLIIPRWDDYRGPALALQETLQRVTRMALRRT